MATCQFTNGPIAQLDRVPDYESGGRGFESSSVRHFPLQAIPETSRKLFVFIV